MPTAPPFATASVRSTRPSPQARTQCLDVTSRAELTLEATPRFLRLAITGELDISTAAELRALLTSIEGVERGVRIDLSEVSFADCTGLAPILDFGQSRTGARRPPLVLSGVSNAVRRLLDLLGDDPGTRGLVAPPPIPVDREAEQRMS